MIETIIMILLVIAIIFLVLGGILRKISCPYNLFVNLPLCMYYWLLDVVFAIIWFFFWGLSFIFIFIPIWVVFSVICLFYKPLCIDISVDDVCIKKKDLFLVVDTLYQMGFEERFLYRNGEDLDNCYCADSVLLLFNPLTTEMRFLEDALKDDGKNFVALAISVTILCALYYTNTGKQSSTK